MGPRYIHLDALRTSLQVIVAVGKLSNSEDWTKWSRPAALSTDDPKRNVQGGWKTPAFREAEARMRLSEHSPDQVCKTCRVGKATNCPGTLC